MHDLAPHRPGRRYPRDSRGCTVNPAYNMVAWQKLLEFLQDHGLDLDEFDALNDGKLIHTSTCRLVADLIEDHKAEYMREFSIPPWWGADVVRTVEDIAACWRYSGGFEQW